MLWGDDVEPESRVERHIPRHVTEGRERDRVVPLAGRPLADLQDQLPSHAASAVVWMNIDLFQVNRSALDQLDVREPDGNIVG